MQDAIVELATKLLEQCRRKNLMIATAESCTGGLIAGALTEVPGSSDVFERGFVTYSNEAKAELLGVEMALIEQHGAVSEDVARAMAVGAVMQSNADLSVAVTGVAGPGGGSAEKPVGLVHIAAAQRAGETIHVRCEFGDPGRSEIRNQTVQRALEILTELSA